MRARWMWNIRQLLLSVWFEGVALPLSLSHITTESQWRSLILTAGGDYWHVYMSKDGRWQNTVKYPALPEKAADSGLPAGALRRKCHAELSLPRPQHGRAGHRDADAEGHRGAPETAHPGEVLP